MFNGYIEVDGKKLPQTLLGSSPFIAAAQFGHRARLYQLDLYSQPENILKVIRKSYQMGVKGIQLIPYPPVVEALEMARDEGLELNILGTVRPGDEEGDIELLSTLEADAMLLHAAITDSCSWDVIAGHLNLMKDEGSVPGLATHQPFRTTRKILESSVLDLFNLYMIPVNKLGYLMDTEFFMEKERDELAELMGKMDKTIIVKKTLAAGIITPQDAFQFLEKVDYADMIALGIAYENEAEVTFGLLFEE
jgi:hypothetical protein